MNSSACCPVQLYVARHNNLDKEKEKVEAATGHLKSACEVIDQGGGYHNQLQDMLAACRGIGAIAVKPLQTDEAKVRTRLLPSAGWLDSLTEEAKGPMDTFLTARFFGEHPHLPF